jgi:predicted ester cyclase
LAELYEERLRERGLTITVITIHRIEGDKIVEEWEMTDMLGLMQQIGAALSPE